MPQIRFTQDYQVNAVGGETYHKDQVVDVSEASAQHFVNRSVAVRVDQVQPQPLQARQPAFTPPAQPEPPKTNKPEEEPSRPGQSRGK